ncbi:hypothetical protein [Sorangium sp. So ce1078]|uniref:hypothetical protein n=1 Tax=Sorangium sp. So ce1078 TaxID=3133329 RepID=UPI003F630856
MPELVSRMFETIEWRDSAPASDGERFDWAQAHKQTAKAIGLDDPRRREFLAAADEAYRSIAAPTPYHRVQHAEALILLRQFAAADARLEEVPAAGRESFWWQRKAQALVESGRAAAARDAIDRALELLKDPKFRAAFLADRSRIRTALADAAAGEDLEAAIDLLPPGDKHRAKLEAELAVLRAGP